MYNSKEPLIDKNRRAATILNTLKKEYSINNAFLNHRNVLDLLVATILSAQCTDERVNKVTGQLFKIYSTAEDYAKADPSELQNHIKSTGYYKTKARNIIRCCQKLIGEFDGKVPKSIDQLTQLPGVGRKTANVILGNYFKITSGIVVDTHVKRISNRLNLSSHSNPVKVETDLTKIYPEKFWFAVGNLFVQHGRNVCKSRKPACIVCGIRNYCPSSLVNN
ncbi:MAG: endonuclease III [Ignavibacteriales bacterium]|nr:endonuclease III [Ignavibacteriales bacterium]